MNKKAKNILIPVVVTLSILLVLEVISRIALSRMYSRRFDWSIIEQGKYGKSGGLKGNAEANIWGKPFHTDDLGGRRHAKSKKGKPKILFIGDSVTEGVGVEDSATFANLVNDRKDSLDVRNISLIGWSYFDYYNALTSLLKVQKDIRSVYVFYCLNDIYGEYTSAELHDVGHRGWVGRINRFLQTNYPTYRFIKLLIYQHSDKYFQYDEALYKDKSRVQKMANSFEQMQQICAENNVTLEVFILPYRSQLQNPLNDLPQRVVTDQLTAKGVKIHDLLPILAKQDDASSLYLFADEIHFSVKGHKAIADEVSGN